MPLVRSAYKNPWYLPTADLQTIVPNIFRVVKGVVYKRERISTPDSDFLDIDWLSNKSANIALLIHGLEASAHSMYIKGMAKALSKQGWCVAAMNLRGCSGYPNVQPRSYHSGSTEDVKTVVDHILKSHQCKNLVIVGFSLGGNLVLKYLGENGTAIPAVISKAVTISVPADLRACAEFLDRNALSIYKNRFLKSLKQKAIKHLPNDSFTLDRRDIDKVHSLVDFDDLYTAPLYGFRNAYDYYAKCSGKNFIQGITVPTLILNARNDPFFTDACLPVEECTYHSGVFLEAPDKGGHVGFSMENPYGYYSEMRTLNFLGGFTDSFVSVRTAG
ncbi:MAG: alpha/beta fold hydrolase [Chitinophagales bacterium]|nr:alpha/beta fold hydrolase [Chitinophagales bacterium]